MRQPLTRAKETNASGNENNWTIETITNYCIWIFYFRFSFFQRRNKKQFERIVLNAWNSMVAAVICDMNPTEYCGYRFNCFHSAFDGFVFIWFKLMNQVQFSWVRVINILGYTIQIIDGSIKNPPKIIFTDSAGNVQVLNCANVALLYTTQPRTNKISFSIVRVCNDQRTRIYWAHETWNLIHIVHWLFIPFGWVSSRSSQPVCG